MAFRIIKVRRKIPYAFAGLALALATWNFMTGDEKILESDPVPELSEEYIMDNFSLTQFDQHGTPIHRITASKARSHKEQVILSKPDIETRVNQSLWQITAEQAVAVQSFNQLTLQQQVKLSEQSSVNQQRLNLSTSSLTYWATQKKITSDAKVTIQDGLFKLSGTGFSVDLLNENYQIDSQVEGSKH